MMFGIVIIFPDESSQALLQNFQAREFLRHCLGQGFFALGLGGVAARHGNADLPAQRVAAASQVVGFLARVAALPVEFDDFVDELHFVLLEFFAEIFPYYFRALSEQSDVKH